MYSPISTMLADVRENDLCVFLLPPRKEFPPIRTAWGARYREGWRLDEAIATGRSACARTRGSRGFPARRTLPRIVIRCAENKSRANRTQTAIDCQTPESSLLIVPRSSMLEPSSLRLETQGRRVALADVYQSARISRGRPISL